MIESFVYRALKAYGSDEFRMNQVLKAHGSDEFRMNQVLKGHGFNRAVNRK
jgi:hypothetical protein